MRFTQKRNFAFGENRVNLPSFLNAGHFALGENQGKSLKQWFRLQGRRFKIHPLRFTQKHNFALSQYRVNLSGFQEHQLCFENTKRQRNKRQSIPGLHPKEEF